MLPNSYETATLPLRRADVHWVSLPPQLEQALAAIAQARCHVLYHWQIGTDPMNYFLPFAAPVPVQCTSWGTHGTSGIAAVDSYLSSTWLEPEGADDHYTERLYRLSTLPTYQSRIPAPPAATRSQFGLPEGKTLYLSPHRLSKYHPDFDPLLARILEADPRGLLVILAGGSLHGTSLLRERLSKNLAKCSDRILILPRQEPAAYYRLLSLADLMLDSPHYCAGLMAYDAFSLGLPIVTLPGQFAVGRYTATLYRKMSLPDLIAINPDQYVAHSVRLGTDPDYCQLLRHEILRRSDVLFDDQEAVREHERVFEELACRHDR